jgi:hypothetical protein
MNLARGRLDGRLEGDPQLAGQSSGRMEAFVILRRIEEAVAFAATQPPPDHRSS